MFYLNKVMEDILAYLYKIYFVLNNFSKHLLIYYFKNKIFN